MINVNISKKAKATTGGATKTSLVTPGSTTTGSTGHAVEADHAAKADYAAEAQHAVAATSADTATEATHAASADEATHATNADEATHAASADEATHATKADLATSLKTTDGSTVIDTTGIKTKNLTVSGKATFFELEIQRASAAGGLTIYSAGTGKIDLVEEIYSTEDTSVLTGWKCYQLFRDADGTTLQQMFKAGDNLVSFSFNTGAGYYTGAANRWWWRRCTAAGFSPVVKDGQRYMTFTVNKTLCAAGSDAPQVGDKVCVLGNSSDADRQRAILVCAYGGLDTGLTAPYFAQYKGINDFDLASHRKSWWGYNSDGDPDNMFIGNFTIQGNSGDDGTPIVRDLGAWKAGTYNYYDRVSYNGSLYLMTNKTAETTTGVPGYSSDWTLQVSKGAQGEAGASINIKGNAVAHYTIDTGKDFSTDGTYLLDSTEDGLSAVVALVSGGAVVQYLTPSTNDTYVTSSDGHLWTYGSAWTDCGVVKGDKGDKGEKGDTGAKGDDGAKGEAGTNGTNGTDAVVYMLVPNQENVTLLASGTVAGGLNYSIYKKVGETLTNIELSTDEYWRWKTENGTIWHNVTEAGSVPISYTFSDDKSGNITVNLLINDIVQDTRIVPITANNDAFLNVNTKLGTIELTTQQHTSDISTLTQSSLEMRGSMASLTTRMGTAESKIATSVQYDKTTGKITSDITLSADKINLSGAITANKEFRIDDWGNVMLGTQYGISTYKYIVEDKSNLIFTANATVSLPNDKEYIGRRIIIMSQPNHTSAGVVVDASNQPVKALSSLPKVEITTGDTFVKGVYGISTQDGATTPSVVIEQADDENSPMYGVKWFGGNCMYYDATNKYYCEPSKLTLRGGYIELLGVSYNVSRVFRAQTGLLNNEYFRVHMARIGEGETTPTTDDPYSTTRTISDTDTLNGTIDVLTSASSSDAWEAITEMCMWTVVNVNAAELTKE